MWTDFFVAAAGASAALAGLVFVSLSVNIASILRASHLPSRAGATIAMLILILVSSMAVLIHQSLPALGAEILVFCLSGEWLQILSARRAFAAHVQLGRPTWEAHVSNVIGQLQVLPFVAGAILLLAGHDNGLYWVAAGAISIFIFSVLNAWILLVEILR